MKQWETVGMHLSPRKMLFAVAAILVISATGAMAQGNLGYLVSEGGFDWMMAKWEATTDEGDKVELEYKWELNKNLIMMRLKWPDFEYRGMIFFVPAKEEVVQVGVDNSGGNGKGTWEAVGGKAVLKHEHTGPYGEINRMGFAHSRADAETMKMEIYEMSSEGELGEEPGITMEFKRQKPEAPKKDSTKAM
jgi:hypothetical protein